MNNFAFNQAPTVLTSIVENTFRGVYKQKGQSRINSIIISNLITKIQDRWENMPTNLKTVEYMGSLDEWGTNIDFAVGKSNIAQYCLYFISHEDDETVAINKPLLAFPEKEKQEDYAIINNYAYYNNRFINSIDLGYVKNITTNYDLNNIQKAFDDTMQNKVYKAFIKIN